MPISYRNVYRFEIFFLLDTQNYPLEQTKREQFNYFVRNVTFVVITKLL